jgi:hypothetical protein
MAAKPEGGEMVPETDSRRLQLKIVSRAATAHRRALWAETRTYMWWLLAIAGGLVFVGTRIGTGFWIRTAVILVGCVVGVVVALIALRLVRREGELANERLRVYDRLVKELGLEEPARATSAAHANKGAGELLGALFGAKSAKLQTEDCFQFGLLLAAVFYGVAFVAMLLYALLR